MDTPPLPQPAQPSGPPWIITQPAPRRKPRIFLWIVVIFLVVGLFGSFGLNLLLLAVLGGGALDEPRVQERFVSHNRFGAEKVAILSIEGTILTGDGFVKQQIDHARKDIADGNLKALVVRVNSPGGTINGSDFILHHLHQLAQDTNVPIVVSMGGMAASGGYYVSMCVGDRPDTIFAEPTTWTGSIGVVIPHYNVAELIQKWGVEADPIASNPLKTMGSIARKMTEEEKILFQKLVDDGFTQFKDAIRQGRPKFRTDSAALDRLATGQVFTAQQALASGLVDKIGFVEDAVDRAIRLAHLDAAKVKVIKYKAEPKLSDFLFGQAVGRSSIDLSVILDSASPRAYYWYCW
ncbi:MAG: signal peptide peptidase SppA [Thermoguttaceae bacterium]